jgi:hypothetical protein
LEDEGGEESRILARSPGDWTVGEVQEVLEVATAK